MKTVIYLGLLTGLLIAVGLWLGGTVGAVIALAIAAVLNFLSYWFSDRIILAIYHAKELTATESPHIHKIVEKLAREAKIPKPKICLIPLSVPNAFATGRNKHKAVLGLTVGLLDELNKEELQGVIAHELSHIKNHDILISAIAATLAGALTILGRVAYFAAFFIPSKDKNNQLGILLSQLALIIVTPLVALLIRMALSRSREYLADREAVKICQTPKGLASALVKLNAFASKFPLIGDSSNRTTSHLFIVNPFKNSLLTRLFSTHPPIEERVKRLHQIKL